MATSSKRPPKPPQKSNENKKLKPPETVKSTDVGRVTIGLQLSLGQGRDDRDLDAVTRLLQEELRALDVTTVEAAGTAKAPASAKGFGLAKVGSLVVELVGGKAFANVLSALKAWIGRDAGRTVKLVIDGDVIEVSGITTDQLEKLIQHYVQQTGSTQAH